MVTCTWVLAGLVAVTALVAALPTGVEKCNMPSDILLIVDKSASVKNWQYEIMRGVISKLIDNLDIGDGETHVAMLLYANGVHKKWCFAEHTDKKELVENVLSMECPECEKGQTSTGLAMEYARTHMFTEACGARDAGSFPRTVVLLTDGKSTESAKLGKPRNFVKTEADKLKSETGAHLVAVGVGNYNEKELADMASDDDSVFTAGDFGELKAMVGELTAGAAGCPAPDVSQCQEGWTYSDITKKCYKFFDEGMPMYEAVAACEEMDAVMPVVNSQAEHEFLASISEGKTWIPLVDDKKILDFHWMHGEDLAYSNWNPGKPNSDVYNNNQHCVIMIDKGLGTRKWNDVGCHKEYRYICETSP